MTNTSYLLEEQTTVRASCTYCQAVTVWAVITDPHRGTELECSDCGSIVS